MKYTIHAYDLEKENDITVECADADDMGNYASALISQGYKKVVALIENEDEKL